MISANELRIGNLIYCLEEQAYNHGRTVTITSLANKVVHWSISMKDEIGGGICHSGTHYEHCEGIPLTPEILENCGFVKCNSPYRDQQAFVIGKDAGRIVWCANELYKPLADGENHFIRITQGTYPIDDYPCQYVHQLQNIIHALTGSDLILTL